MQVDVVKRERPGKPSKSSEPKSNSEREAGWIDDSEEWMKDDGWLQ